MWVAAFRLTSKAPTDSRSCSSSTIKKVSAGRSVLSGTRRVQSSQSPVRTACPSHPGSCSTRFADGRRVDDVKVGFVQSVIKRMEDIGRAK